MNRLLAIETSGEACSVALHLDGAMRERHEHAPLRHAELLLPAVRSLLEEAQVPLNSLDAVVFGRGPGSFTSLRIGIGVVQGLAWGADLPVVPLSSLSGVAQQLLDFPTRGIGAEHEILVAVDARMQEVFHGRFKRSDGIVMPLGEEGVSSPASLQAAKPVLTFGAGNGFARYPALVEMGQQLLEVHPELVPRASALIPLAQHWLELNAPLKAEEAQPVYVRNQVAEKAK